MNTTHTVREIIGLCFVTKMVRIVSEEKKKIILKIYQYFDSKRKRGHPFYSLDKVADRTIQALGVSRSLLYSLLKKSTKCENSVENSKPMKRDSLDSFEDLIRRVVQNLFSKNEFVSLKKLRTYLAENQSKPYMNWALNIKT